MDEGDKKKMLTKDRRLVLFLWGLGFRPDRIHRSMRGQSVVLEFEFDPEATANVSQEEIIQALEMLGVEPSVAEAVELYMRRVPLPIPDVFAFWGGEEAFRANLHR